MVLQSIRIFFCILLFNSTFGPYLLWADVIDQNPLSHLPKGSQFTAQRAIVFPPKVTRLYIQRSRYFENLKDIKLHSVACELATNESEAHGNGRWVWIARHISINQKLEMQTSGSWYSADLYPTWDAQLPNLKLTLYCGIVRRECEVSIPENPSCIDNYNLEIDEKPNIGFVREQIRQFFSLSIAEPKEF